jgi:aspartokinase/homoserine dehydrogenase 1
MEKKINIFLVGTGNVGKSFIELIAQKNLYQITGNKFRIRIIGIANRSKMYFSKRGLIANKWKSFLTTGKVANVDLFIETMEQYRLPNSIFIDCTDGDEISRYYKVILKQFPIVTSNKSLNAGSYKNYLEIRDTIKKYNTDFRYSANVGVGLPSLDIINSFLQGGDKVTAIEGLFSSTMNYLLDKLLTTDKPFSRLLLEAKEKGLTEPDPRNDLNGIDTGRKILILAREVGAKIEMNDIIIENHVPVILRNIKSLDKFYNSIKIADSKFERIKRIAVNNKRKLVYTARFKNNKASVGIEMVDQTHPFYSASANEKVVLFYTEFFKHYPLVIKGQSGGAKATASVLISDILKTVG